MKRHISRRSFLKKVAGATSAAVFIGPQILSARSPNEKVGFAFVATGGQGGAGLGMANEGVCVAYCDVDKNHWGGMPKKWPKAKAYTDYRKMFENHMKEIDAVAVATPDHNHATASLMAMKEGKGVYCEKPLTWSVAEARAMAEMCAKKKVPTQMGNHEHANDGNRRVVGWVRSGAIGEIKEVHTWTNRPVWGQGIKKRPPSKPVPENLDWEAWLGPAPFREFHDGLHGFHWRGWFDFGCGAVGDMGCHTWDCVNWAMEPSYPTSVQLLAMEGDGRPETFPKKSHFKWEFPAKGKRAAFTAHWYAKLKPPVPECMEGRRLSDSGSLFLGSKATLYVPGDYGGGPRIEPKEKRKEIGDAPKLIERSPGHRREFLMAVKGEKPWDFPKSNFTYAGPMTELMLLGCIAIHIGEVGFEIKCDPAKREVITPKAKAYVSRVPRKGWEV